MIVLSLRMDTWPLRSPFRISRGAMIAQIESARGRIEAGIDRQSLRQFLPASSTSVVVSPKVWRSLSRRACVDSD